MIARLLPVLKGHLERHCAPLWRSIAHTPGQDEFQAPEIVIGIPGSDADALPRIILAGRRGCCLGGESLAEVSAMISLPLSTAETAEALELRLGFLAGTITGALRPCLDVPLEDRFRLDRDEMGRTCAWRRDFGRRIALPDSAQVTMLSRWTAPGWE